MSKGEVTRQVILERATNLATKIGLGALTIGTLAGSLEMSKSGLYAHFKSKENLQVDIVWNARERFVETVIQPAIKVPRGVPRLRALFERWMAWGQRPGGCIFIQLSTELDDRPGRARDALVQAQLDWLDTIATAAGIAQDEGHLRRDFDKDQFAFELYAVMLMHHHATKLLADKLSAFKTRNAFDSLIERYSTKRR